VTKPRAVPFEDLRGKKKAVVRYTDIFLDSGAAEAINRAQIELETAEGIARNKPADLEAQVRRDQARSDLERLQEEVVENEQVVRFSFRGISRKAFERMKDEHPPTPEQQKKAREEGLAAGIEPELTRLHWDADKFPPALVAAASLEPKITPEEAYELFHVSEDWNEAELASLFLAALAAQQGRDSAALGKLLSGSATTPS
jgi:hypothetical protein